MSRLPMSMPTLVDEVASILGSALEGVLVEKYWRLARYEGPVAFVMPQSETGEEPSDLNAGASASALSGGTWFQRLRLLLAIECPADDQQEAGETVGAIVETVKAALADNRDLAVEVGDDTQVASIGTRGEVEYVYLQKPADNQWVWTARIACSWRVGKGA